MAVTATIILNEPSGNQYAKTLTFKDPETMRVALSTLLFKDDKMVWIVDESGAGMAFPRAAFVRLETTPPA